MTKLNCGILVIPVAHKDTMKSQSPVYQHEIMGLPLYQYVSFPEFGETPEILGEEGFPGNRDFYILIPGNMPLLQKEDVNALLEAHVAQFHGNVGHSITLMGHGKGRIAGADASVVESLGAVPPEEVMDVLASRPEAKKLEPACRENFLYVENRQQLSWAWGVWRDRINSRHMDNGVTFVSPETVFIGRDVAIGEDTVIFPGCFLEGSTRVGSGCIIGAYSRLTDMIIGNNVHIESSVLLSSSIGDSTSVGPFAYVRPGSQVGSHAKIGDFVEVKNAVIGDGTKASHLTYIGDADVGDNVNFGCGTVLVNYDGKKKHRTTIGDNVFVGCNSNLVSPVTVGEGAYIAAGSTITSEIPAKSLAIARARQVNKDNWKDKREK